MQDYFFLFDLFGFVFSLYVQGIEEGILVCLMEWIVLINCFCVDIGVSDGLCNSNMVWLLCEYDWVGVFVEGSVYWFGKFIVYYVGVECVCLYYDCVQFDMVD